VPGQPGLRTRTRAGVFADAASGGVKLRIDGTEVQVRRPPAGRPGRRAFVSGTKKQNTIKATAVSDGQGRLLWLGAFRPGRMHDVTALRTDGIEDLRRRHPDVQAEVDAGYQGLARDFPAQVSAPPEKPRTDTPAEETASWEQRRHQQSSERICTGHAIAEPRQWRALQRWPGRREYFQETALAVAGLVSDRAATR
jgi:DDE superfamily endonuclease